MARVNAFLRAGNDAGRDVSVGGRGRSDRVWVLLNTDNGGRSDCSLHVSAEVAGESALGGAPRKLCDCGYRWEAGAWEERICPECNTIRQGIDTRKSVFTVELPEQSDDFCEVEIQQHGARWDSLIRFGAALCGVKAAQEAAAGEQDQAVRTIEGARKILQELDENRGSLPRVTLPGGVDMAHALACVRIVQGLLAEGGVSCS